jgi:hypothetical protein
MFVGNEIEQGIQDTEDQVTSTELLHRAGFCP